MVARAREFVLDDKRKTLQSEIDKICQIYWDADDDAFVIPEIRKALERTFDITVNLEDEQLIDLVSASAPQVATLVAKKLLDRNPPTTKPVWWEPWGAGFPYLDIEQSQGMTGAEPRP